jgi:hypothetical protein
MSTMDALSLFPLLIHLLPDNLAFMRVSTKGRKNLVRHPNTGFELFQKALPEKLAEKLAEKWVSASPQFQPQPSYPLLSIHDHPSSFFADTENLFAIEAIICNLSSAIEPVKVLYTESRAHRPDKQLLCSHLNPLTGFQQEQDSPRCEADARALGFLSPLKRWVDYALSTTKQKKLLHFAYLRPRGKTAFSQ